MSEVKDKNERKQLVTYKGTAIRKPVVFFLAESFQNRRAVLNTLKMLKRRKKTNQEYSIWQSYHLKLMERQKDFQLRKS